VQFVSISEYLKLKSIYPTIYIKSNKYYNSFIIKFIPKKSGKNSYRCINAQVYKFEDDWWIVKIKNYIRGYEKENSIFKCDQWDGLVNLLNNKIK